MQAPNNIVKLPSVAKKEKGEKSLLQIREGGRAHY